jgi:hypothetical protein
LPLTACKAMSSNVDFPTPGSPPTSTSEAGTMPPPSTRSSSGTPVEIRSASSASTSSSLTSGFASVAARPASTPEISSTSVPKPPQPGHRPNQRPVVVPHSEHTCWTRTFAIEPV